MRPTFLFKLNAEDPETVQAVEMHSNRFAIAILDECLLELREYACNLEWLATERVILVFTQ